MFQGFMNLPGEVGGGGGGGGTGHTPVSPLCTRSQCGYTQSTGNIKIDHISFLAQFNFKPNLRYLWDDFYFFIYFFKFL